MPISRRLLLAATAAYLMMIGWITLGPQPYHPRSGVLDWALALFAAHPLTGWITLEVVEFAANIALFVPFAALLTLLAGPRRWWLAVLAGLTLSAAIELAQLGLPTRVSDPRDLLSNGLGSVAGALSVLLLVRRPAAHP